MSESNAESFIQGRIRILEQGMGIMEAKTTTCTNCKWFKPSEHRPEARGECRINAPAFSGFPLLFPNDWCGRFERWPTREEREAVLRETERQADVSSQTFRT